MDGLKNIPPRIAILQLLTERTGAVSRQEVMTTICNMWIDDKECGPLIPHFLGRCVSDLTTGKYIRCTKKHTAYSKRKDLFIVTDKGRSLLSGEIQDESITSGKTISHVSVINAENKSKFKRMKEKPAAWNIRLVAV